MCYLRLVLGLLIIPLGLSVFFLLFLEMLIVTLSLQVFLFLLLTLVSISSRLLCVRVGSLPDILTARTSLERLPSSGLSLISRLTWLVRAVIGILVRVVLLVILILGIFVSRWLVRPIAILFIWRTFLFIVRHQNRVFPYFYSFRPENYISDI